MELQRKVLGPNLNYGLGSIELVSKDFCGDLVPYSVIKDIVGEDCVSNENVVKIYFKDECEEIPKRKKLERAIKSDFQNYQVGKVCCQQNSRKLK
jgi:hypothetical protein